MWPSEQTNPSTPGFQVDWKSHIEQLPLATWICNPDGKCAFLNLACKRLLGVFQPQDLAGEKWTRHVHPDDLEPYLKSWKQFVHSKAHRFKEKLRWIRPDTGQAVALNVRVQKLNSGRFQGWIREATAESALSRLEELSK